MFQSSGAYAFGEEDFSRVPYIILCNIKGRPFWINGPSDQNSLNNFFTGSLDDAIYQVSKLWDLCFWRRRFLKIVPI